MVSGRVLNRCFLLAAMVLSFSNACDSNQGIEERIADTGILAGEAELKETQPEISPSPAATETYTPAPTATTTGTATAEPAPTATAQPTVTSTPAPTATPAYDLSVYGKLDALDPGGVTLSFWHPFDGFRQQKLVEIIEMFNADNEHGVTITAVDQGRYSDIYSQMVTALATGELPDLVAAFPNQAADYAALGVIVSLEPYLNHSIYGLDDQTLVDLFPAVVTADRQPHLEDELYGFALSRSMELLYVNADWLAELDLPFTGPPQTPGQFAMATCAATDPATGTVGYEVERTTSNFVAWIFAFGGEIYDVENNLFTFETPAALAAMTMLQELLQAGCARVADGFRYQDNFGNRKTLFGPGTSAGLYFYGRAVAQGQTGPFAWQVAPFPHTTERPVQYLSGPSLSIARTGPASQLAAWLFLKYWMSSEIQARWGQVNDHLPARAGAAGGLQNAFAANPAYETAFQLLPDGKSPPPASGHFEVWQAMINTYGRILRGEDVAAALVELDEAANQALANREP